MNIGKKKTSLLESPEKCVDTSGYLNVLVNSQWRPCWCLIKNGQLWFYQDKGKNKVSQPAVTLGGCSVLPDPSPEHLYSFRIDMDGTQLATLEAKTVRRHGPLAGPLAVTDGDLMQRRYSEPNTYIDTQPSLTLNSDELYDDVASIADPEDTEESGLPDIEDNNLQEHDQTCAQDTQNPEEDTENRIYLDLVPVRSFLHTSCGSKTSPAKETSRHSLVAVEDQKDASSQMKEPRSHKLNQSRPHPKARRPQRGLSLGIPQAFSSSGVQIHKVQTAAGFPHSPQPLRPKSHTIGSPGAVEGKLGKNRTEADLRRYIDERDRLEKEREEMRSSLATLKKERREIKEELGACQDPKQQASLEARLKQKEEACREAERRRVEVELRLVEVKESLKKVESGPFTLGTTLDSSLQDTPTSKTASLPAQQTSSSSSSSSSQPANSSVSADPGSPVNSASALKSRPASIMATKGKVLQKAKEWEKKSTT
ncbi:Actin filament-associated protein 1-like 2 [Larimichthys crocea]|uniref:Uncharacterized protein n=1 Tax=Larimichthys crocea TaxID=215358 RepID=A0ACD3RRQ1_LARCR|nr:Actin filament-associated protein 1-like 2 [Larimichthys crocea]